MAVQEVQQQHQAQRTATMQEIQQAEEEIQAEWEQANTAMEHMMAAALIWTDKYDEDRLAMQEDCAGWTMGSAEHHLEQHIESGHLIPIPKECDLQCDGCKKAFAKNKPAFRLHLAAREGNFIGAH